MSANGVDSLLCGANSISSVQCNFTFVVLAHIDQLDVLSRNCNKQSNAIESRKKISSRTGAREFKHILQLFYK